VEIVIAPYDSSWPVQFETERTRIAEVTAAVDRVIEHVGGTAVPGLGAKPIVDIMLGVHSLSRFDRLRPDFEAAGYIYERDFEEQIPERRFFIFPPVSPCVAFTCMPSRSMVLSGASI